MSIIVTGASGKLGRLVVDRLLERISPEQIVLAVRQPDEVRRYMPHDVEVRLADYDLPSTLATAFAGASRLLLISSSHTDDTVRIRQHVHAVEAAKAAGAEHLVYTSFAYPDGKHISLTDLHLATEYAIRTTGIPYTFMRNALYTDIAAAFGLHQGALSGQLVTYPGRYRFNTVTREDLASAFAAILTEDGHGSQTYECTASRTWDFPELAQALTELTSKPIVHREDENARSWVYGFVEKVDTVTVSPHLETLLGRPTTSLIDAVARLLPSE